MTLALAVLLLLGGKVYGQIISQYVETNSGTTPKGIEIWNNTASTLDFTTNNLVIKKGTNGAAPSDDYTLDNGTLASGEVIVIGTSDMETTTVANGSLFYLKAFSFNGDDALEVWYGTSKTDVFGDPGTGDPGSGWSGNGVQTWNQNISLKSGITDGDIDGWTDPSIRFETTCTDNCLTGFGIPPVASGDPVITNITQTPTLPNSSETVSVSADITDDGTLTDVTVNWGLTSGNLTNDIFMTLSTGDTYVTDSDIPAQADGTTVYYEVYALDDEDGSTTSPEQSYTVTNLSPEPSGHVTDFAAATITTNAIPLDWTDSDADYYLIKAVETGGTITPPVDGTAEADDLLVKNVASGVESVTFTGLSSFTSYTFEIYPYNGTGTTVNYKTDGTVPSVVASTLGIQTALPYSQDFASGLDDCSTFSVSGDTKVWSAANGYAEINGYNGSNPEEDWLILPEMDLSSYSNVIMTFESWWKYAVDNDVNYLKLYYSEDYPGFGDPTGSNWTELYFPKPDNQEAWRKSGTVDLTAVSGASVFIAFKYYSTDNPRSWRVDNIEVFEGTPIDVTFQVNMADQTPSANGVHMAGDFNAWSPSATELTDGDADEVYTVTLTLFSDQEYQFKYINGNAWGSEETVPSECQALGTTNRFAIIGDANYALDPVCFSSCTDCGFMPSYDVTFQVDMANETITEGVFIAGTFNGWSTTENPMTLQSGSTTIYEITLPIEEASYIMYKFINGTSWEDNIGAACTDNGNRYYTVPGNNSTIDLVCFGSCTACVQPYDITFQVNMMNETVSGDGVYLAGSFTDWGTNAIAMTQTGTIWSTTVSIMGNSTVFYKFVNGNPIMEELGKILVAIVWTEEIELISFHLKMPLLIRFVLTLVMLVRFQN
jgi:hypothetical protein